MLYAAYLRLYKVSSKISLNSVILCADAQAKVWITIGGDKILGRLRTRRKPQSCSPIFNEALTATVEPSQMKIISVNVAITNESKQAMKKELGQVILCAQSSAEEFRHWNDVLASPGKQIAEWHELRSIR